MTATRAIAAGLAAAARNKWMVSLFFACNLLMAAAVAAPMYSAIADHVGGSMVGKELAQGFNAAWLSEFSISYDAFLKGFSTAIVYAGILFLALNTVLSGGAFEVLVRGEGARLHAFGRGLGKFFGRFARLAVVGSILYFVAFWFFNGPVSDWLTRAFRGVNPEHWHFYLNWLRIALLVLVVLVINALVEFAKADAVIDEHRSAATALLHAAGFLVAHFRKVLVIYLSLAVLAGVVIAAYVGFANLIPQHTVATIFLWFAVAQAAVWLRWALRVACWGAVVAYRQAQQPAAVEMTAPAPSAAAADVV